MRYLIRSIIKNFSTRYIYSFQRFFNFPSIYLGRMIHNTNKTRTRCLLLRLRPLLSIVLCGNTNDIKSEQTDQPFKKTKDENNSLLLLGTEKIKTDLNKSRT